MDVLTFANTKQSVLRAFDTMRGDPTRPHLMGLPLPSESAMRRHRIRDNGLGAGGGVGTVVEENIRAFLVFQEAVRQEEQHAQERMLERVATVLADSCVKLQPASRGAVPPRFHAASVDSVSGDAGVAELDGLTAEQAGEASVSHVAGTAEPADEAMDNGEMHGGGRREEEVLTGRMLHEWRMMETLDKADAALAAVSLAEQVMENDLGAEMLGAAFAAVAVHLGTAMYELSATAGKKTIRVPTLALTLNRSLALRTSVLEIMYSTPQGTTDASVGSPVLIVNVARVWLKTAGSTQQLVCELSCTSTPVVFGISAEEADADGFLVVLQACMESSASEKRSFLEAAHARAVKAATDVARACLQSRMSETILCSVGFDECDLDQSLETDRNFKGYGDADLHYINRDDPRPAQRLYARIMMGLDTLIVSISLDDYAILLEALSILCASLPKLDADVAAAQAKYDKRAALYEARNLKRAGIKTKTTTKTKIQGQSKSKSKSTRKGSTKGSTKAKSAAEEEEVCFGCPTKLLLTTHLSLTH